ncbi:MAG TPA: hypothetical protein VFI16_00020 [Anaeromyxobacteraceae bacterium]|nr:hypothetical protein [Anaeromyxobacteraceae bacterium]
MTAIDGVSFAEAWPDRLVTDYGGERVAVIGRRHLVVNERASGPPQDLVDVDLLERGG